MMIKVKTLVFCENFMSTEMFTLCTFFCGKIFPSSADSRRASCQLLAKECSLNTGKLPPGGLPRNSVVN